MKTLTLTLAVASSCFNACTQPHMLTTEHCDLRVVYQTDATNKLVFRVRDSDRGINYAADEVVLEVTEAARLTLPGDYPPLGTAGTPIWVLPATQNPEALYLGLSGDGIPQGIFDGPVDIQLLSVTGPGEFFVWQAVGTGGLEFQVDTTDGVDELDAVPLHPGGHSHHNWGFTSNGIVSINLQATARRLGAATNETSIETTVTFHVLPLPDEPESPFALWQSEHWPGTTDPSVIGPDADPDLDGVLNVFEYAFALDPKAPQTTGLPELSIEEVTGESWAVLTYRQAVVATDLQFEPVATADLSQPTWQPLTNVLSPVDQGPYQLIAVRDSTPLAATKSRFFQLRVQFR